MQIPGGSLQRMFFPGKEIRLHQNRSENENRSRRLPERNCFMKKQIAESGGNHRDKIFVQTQKRDRNKLLSLVPSVKRQGAGPDSEIVHPQLSGSAGSRIGSGENGRKRISQTAPQSSVQLE